MNFPTTGRLYSVRVSIDGGPYEPLDAEDYNNLWRDEALDIAKELRLELQASYGPVHRIETEIFLNKELEG